MKGRPLLHTDDTIVAISSSQARSKLQVDSERRAIINVIVDNGGKMTLKQINKHFGFDIRARVVALIDIGWLKKVNK